MLGGSATNSKDAIVGAGAVTLTLWVNGWPWTTVADEVPRVCPAASRAISVTCACASPGEPIKPTNAPTWLAVAASRPTVRGV
jgi:hypothetical protein